MIGCVFKRASLRLDKREEESVWSLGLGMAEAECYLFFYKRTVVFDWVPTI